MTTIDRDPLLVLWDVDQTLLEVWSATQRAYASAFRRATGRTLQQPWQFEGRTELAAVQGVLLAHGIEASQALVGSFLELIVDELSDQADLMRRTGRVLPGAENALRACAAVPGVHQSLLTGNLYQLALLKMTVFGLGDHVDMRIGAFGGDSVDRTDLPSHAWRRAEQHLGHRFRGSDTVIIGDTLLDVATGKAAGARVIAVATGPVDETQLQAAGADVVLPDLTDSRALVEAVLAPRSRRARTF